MIKARVDYDDRTKTYYTQSFELRSYLPDIETTKKYNNEIIAIEEVQTDCEDYDNNSKYNFYKLISVDYEDYNDAKLEDNDITLDEFTGYEYIAIEEEFYE